MKEYNQIKDCAKVCHQFVLMCRGPHNTCIKLKEVCMKITIQEHSNTHSKTNKTGAQCGRTLNHHQVVLLFYIFFFFKLPLKDRQSL